MDEQEVRLALYTAIHHYESEAKQGKAYAKPLIPKLRRALRIVEKYESFVNLLVVSDEISD